jgi:hypothetical protein
MFRRNHDYHLFFFLARDLLGQVSGFRFQVSAKNSSQVSGGSKQMTACGI